MAERGKTDHLFFSSFSTNFSVLWIQNWGAWGRKKTEHPRKDLKRVIGSKEHVLGENVPFFFLSKNRLMVTIFYNDPSTQYGQK